ncbi:MAG: pyridoxal phosphate-dependent aminotransferase [Deltaproteobacteria bacterium]|nr:pyridoxal phosphate-dependent aminotransferase [Deltaproteobacteria bacterium]
MSSELVKPRPGEARGISAMAQKLIANEILKIAAEIRALVRGGAQILNLTIGDFKSDQFPIPELLKEGTKRALDQGHSNYPPANGVLEAREAVRELFLDRFGLDYPVEGVLLGGGARPMIAASYMCLVSPGERVVYSLPSWNNNHYSTIVGANQVELPTTEATGFFPRVEDIEPHLEGARLICLNTPQNPTGTVMKPAELERLCREIVRENERRLSKGKPVCYLLFDQVYWMLTFGDARHATPVNLVPEMARYTIFVDAISKSFAATGLRVGWGVGPSDVIERMAALLTHLGAWAPHPEQVATAALLRDKPALDAYHHHMSKGVLARLEALARGARHLAAEGLPVDSIDPEGAIYLSLRLAILGKRAPGGEIIASDEAIRGFLLREAGVALVPFQAFGVKEETGWFRASVGAVSVEDCERAMARIGDALRRLEPG